MIFLYLAFAVVWLVMSFVFCVCAEIQHTVDKRDEPFSYVKNVPLCLLWPILLPFHIGVYLYDITFRK